LCFSSENMDKIAKLLKEWRAAQPIKMAELQGC
jgi:hypothetical protein